MAEEQEKYEEDQVHGTTASNNITFTEEISPIIETRELSATQNEVQDFDLLDKIKSNN